MANFIGLVYATLKNEGIDTKDMSTDEAVKKYNELQKKAGGKAGEKEGTPAEQKRLKQVSTAKPTKTETTTNNKEFEKDISLENNMDIDWDVAEKNEKINGKNAKNPNRHDKYGNPLLSDEAFNIGLEAGKAYLDYQEKYGSDINKLKRSNQFLGGISSIIGNAITNNGYDPEQDITYTDYNQIIGNLIGEEIDMAGYEGKTSSGFTGRKYIDYKPN